MVPRRPATRGDRIKRAAAGGIKGDARDRRKGPGRRPGSSTCTRTPSVRCGASSLRDARVLLAQGVTTIVGNPDGTDRYRRAAAEPGSRGVGVNVALMIGHGKYGLGAGQRHPREPDAAELDRMKTVVAKAKSVTAPGLSSGLFYEPGRYSKLEEVIALARVAGGVYTSHVRDEGDYTIGLVVRARSHSRAEEAGVRGVVTHVKALGPDSWGFRKP